jgi:hypothetical protein
VARVVGNRSSFTVHQSFEAHPWAERFGSCTERLGLNAERFGSCTERLGLNVERFGPRAQSLVNPPASQGTPGHSIPERIHAAQSRWPARGWPVRDARAHPLPSSEGSRKNNFGIRPPIRELCLRRSRPNIPRYSAFSLLGTVTPRRPRSFEPILSRALSDARPWGGRGSGSLGRAPAFERAPPSPPGRQAAPGRRLDWAGAQPASSRRRPPRKGHGRGA